MQPRVMGIVLASGAGKRLAPLTVVPHNTAIGRGALVRNAIIGKDVMVPDGAQIGCNKEDDRARGFVVTDAGVTVAGKGQPVPC